MYLARHPISHTNSLKLNGATLVASASFGLAAVASDVLFLVSESASCELMISDPSSTRRFFGGGVTDMVVGQFNRSSALYDDDIRALTSPDLATNIRDEWNRK